MCEEIVKTVLEDDATVRIKGIEVDFTPRKFRMRLWWLGQD